MTVYNCDVYTGWYLNLNINKVKCLVFNKTNIPLTLVGYELSKSSYTTRVRGIIAKYTGKREELEFVLYRFFIGCNVIQQVQRTSLAHCGRSVFSIC